MTLYVFIELNGTQRFVGTIADIHSGEGQFCYASEYLKASDSAPISCRLPLQEEPFSSERTRTFFEGLLPEGFTRRSVAGWIHADANDYLTILANLGKECLGAIRILDNPLPSDNAGYRKLTMDQVKELAREGASKSAELVTKSHLSLTGASGKAGLYYHPDTKEWYLPVGCAPSTHIVKQSHIRLEAIVTNEQLSLMTAKACGLPVPDSFIINLDRARDEDVLFATERFDRIFSPDRQTFSDAPGMEFPVPLRLHQEDFSQALGIHSLDKYETEKSGYLERCFSLLRQVSANPIEDQMRLWNILIYDFLVGNTDNHIKNLSLLYGENLRQIRLAPAYDIVSTCVYDASTRDMAIYLGDACSLDHISRDSLTQAAHEAGLSTRMALRSVDTLAGRFEAGLRESAAFLKDAGFSQAEYLRDRILKNGGFRQL